MADKQISQLIAAETVNDEDLLVLQQGQIAKKLTGKKLGDYLYAAAAEKIAEVNEAVAETQEAVDELEEQKNTIAQTIADMAELGTDTTLTTPGMAADAKATGDRIGEVEVQALASLNQKTVSDVLIASFDDGADNVPVKELIIDINAVQSGSGDPSPDNVRPITGWTKANIYKSNVNLCGGDAMLAQIINNGNDASRKSSDDDGDYYSLYAASSANGKTYISGFFKPNTRYTFMLSLKGSQNSQTNIRVLYTDGTSSHFSAPSSSDKQLITMVTSSGKTVSGLIGWYHNNINVKLYYNDSGVFEGSVSADDFVKATGSAYQADWETEAGTVYGAKLNATSGKLLVNTGVDNLSSLTWAERYTGSVNKVISASLSNAAVVSQGTGIRYIDGIAEQYTNRGQKGAISDFSDPDSLDVGFYCIAGSSTTNTSTLYLVIPVANSAAGKIKYKLYNSTTEYDLDPVVIKTLYKTNNIWADTGNVNSLIYYSMTVDNNYVIEKMRQIEGMISGVEPSGVASTNYVLGSLIISKDVLVRLIANVVSGETISTGTGGNAIETTIEAELQAIKNSIPIVAGDISYDDTETYPEYTVGSELKRLSLEEASQSEKIVNLENDSYNYLDSVPNGTSLGWRLKTDGFSVSDQSYKIVKYPVSVGDFVRITSDDKWQFQNSSSVPASGTNNRVGVTYEAGTFFVKVPATVTYIIISTPSSGSTANVSNVISAKTEIDFVEGTDKYNYIKLANGSITDNGITYQIDSEKGTIKTSGTSGGSGFSKITFYVLFPAETGQYYISGCPAGGTGSSGTSRTVNYQLGLWGTSENRDMGLDGGNGFVCTLTAGNRYSFYVQFGKNRNSNDLVFTPLCVKRSSASPFRPYLPSLKNLDASAPLSILEIGGKNDGSVDIAPIINQFTKIATIYLPLGKYLVSSPIKLVNSLIGENNIRSFNSTIPLNNSSVLVSNLETGDIVETIGNSSLDTTISNINIWCNSNESAIKIGSNSRVKISNVSIGNLGSANGIYANRSDSRNVYVDNVTIFADKNKESIGIDISAPDCRLTNIEIMYCQIGIKLNGIQYMSDVHVWTGSNESITKEWYDGTIGVYCGNKAKIFGTNVYVDSAYNAFWFAGGRAWIANLITWDDGTGSSLEDTIYLTHKEGTAYLYVNGGCYKSSGRMSVGSDATNLLTNFIGV